LGFENFAVPIEKVPASKKKREKPKFSNSVENKKKTISEKSSSTKFLYPLGESMFKKSAKYGRIRSLAAWSILIKNR
jgi:hypothetical protein